MLHHFTPLFNKFAEEVQGKRIWKRLLAVDGRKAPPSWQLFLGEK
jgi:hypothetical protein